VQRFTRIGTGYEIQRRAIGWPLSATTNGNTCACLTGYRGISIMIGGEDLRENGLNPKHSSGIKLTHFSQAKICFQSFLILITVNPFDFASS
jgi:hypothetical protein